MLCYRYLVQPTSEEDKRVFGTTHSLVNFLNERIGMKGVYTSDMVQNYFKPRKTRKVTNPLLASLYQLTRDRTDKSISSV